MIVGAFACLWQRVPKAAALLTVAAVACVLIVDQGRWATGYALLSGMRLIYNNLKKFSVV